MQAEPPRGFRGFLRTRPGRVVFLLLAIGIVFAAYAYVATILAIPVFLVVGLALPIWAGLKRPRFLALAGLVVLVTVAPLATVVFSQELLVPPSAASSAGVAPYESGGAVLQHASITPFIGTSSTTYTWNVTLYPRFLASYLNRTNWTNDSLQLFVSTCPGATSANDSLCGSSYTLIVLNHTFAQRTAPANGTVVTFQDRITTRTIWSWQMQLVLQNTTNASNPTRIELVGDLSYNGIEGPVVGGYLTAYIALIGTIYEIDLLYLGLPFYFILILYMMFKGREARRRQAIRNAIRLDAARGMPPGGAGAGGPVTPGGPSTSPAPAATPASSEIACANCGAVVYPNESKCWKCGSALGASAPTDRPLASTPSEPEKPGPG
jgi:hypothetical protein